MKIWNENIELQNLKILKKWKLKIKKNKKEADNQNEKKKNRIEEFMISKNFKGWKAKEISKRNRTSNIKK